MKKITILLSAVFMILSFSACAKCRASNCEASMNDQVAAANSFDTTTMKKLACASLTVTQSYYGADCKVEWK